MTIRRVVVTGGSRGIGRACVEAFASTGYDVVAVGRDPGALEAVATTARTHRWPVATKECDVTDSEAVAALFAELDLVDILINSAGASSSASFDRTDVAEVERLFAVNVAAALTCTKAVVGGMRERHWGRLVFVGSVCGLVGLPYTTAYTISKHAVVGLMRVVASELAGSGITANAICPTYVASEMTDRTLAVIAKSTGRDRAAALERLVADSPLGRLLQPSEVAHTALFLASDAASAVCGQAIVMDGGGIQH